MNYRVLFIVLVVLMTAFHIWMAVLEVESTKKEVPDYLKGIYDDEKYKTFQAYTKEKVSFSIVHSLVSMVVTLVMFLSPLFASIGNAISNPFGSGVLIVLVYSAINSLVSIPLAHHDTFVIEEKYGFNKTTKKTFIEDLIKDFIISFLVQWGLVAVFIWLYGWLGTKSVLYISIILLAFILVLNILSPILVQINFKKTPLEEGDLRTQLTELLVSEGYQVKDIYTVDGSKRSTKANAFFTGVGKLKSIMLFDTLVDLMTPREIVAVFAHELGHGKNKDSQKGIIVSFINLVLMMAGVVYITAYCSISESFGFTNTNLAFVMLVILECGGPVFSTIFGIFSNYVSRCHEYKADAMAKKKGYGDELVSALKKLGVNNFANLTPNELIVALTYSHPSLGQRIKALTEKN